MIWWCPLCNRQTCLVAFSALNLQFEGRHVAQLQHIILQVFTLTHKCCVLSGEAAYATVTQLWYIITSNWCNQVQRQYTHQSRDVIYPVLKGGGFVKRWGVRRYHMDFELILLMTNCSNIMCLHHTNGKLQYNNVISLNLIPPIAIYSNINKLL
jgi:hypothetical protein